MFRAFRYYISQAAYGMTKNKLMVFISISTLVFCLLLLGLAISFGLNLNYISDQLEAQFEVQAYVDLSFTEDEARALESEIKRISGIKSFVFSTKEQELEIVRDMFDDEKAFEGLEEDNPLHYAYKFSLTNINMASSVEASLKKIRGIDSVSNRTDILNGITTFTSIAGHVSLIGMLIFAVIAVFIISNTIKLAVMSRKREIEIMRSVGATNGFIRSPFIIEGIIVGLIGGLIAFIPVYFGYGAVLTWWSGLYGIFRLLPLESISMTVIIVFLLAGSIIGAIGSINSVRKYLNT